MNETDRTIVGLLWHENIVDAISKQDKKRLKAMGRNGREYAKKEFSKNSLINKLNKILNELSTKKKL